MTKTSLPNVKKPCRHCPFRKDTLKGWLGGYRITGILESNSFVCHKKQNLQCAGHMLIKGNDNSFVKMAGLMDIELELSGRELVFSTQSDCITHHAN
jgi:hypothetical protein